MSIPVLARLAGSSADPCCCSAPAVLAHRYKRGVARPCGFPEYIPSVPPRYYRTKARSGVLYKGTWDVPDCPATPPNDHEYSMTVGPITFTIAGEDGYHHWWKVKRDVTWTIYQRVHNGELEVKSVISWGADYADPPIDYHLGLIVNAIAMAADGITYLWFVDSYTIPAGWGPWSKVSGWRRHSADFWEIPDHYEAYGVADDGNGDGLQIVPIPFPPLQYGALDSFRDEWDRTQQYVPNPHAGAVTTCDLTETDNAVRVDQPFGPFPLTDGGVQVAGPNEADYAGLTNDPSLTDTTRTVAGKDTCSGSGPIYQRLRGSLVDTLGDEDSPDDAVARNKAGKAWRRCVAGEDLCTAFCVQSANSPDIFYEDIQVQAKIGPMAPNTTYKMIIKVCQRVWGSNAAWQPYDTIEVTFNSGSQTTWLSAWYDLPIEAGIVGMAMERAAFNVVALVQP